MNVKKKRAKLKKRNAPRRENAAHAPAKTWGGGMLNKKKQGKQSNTTPIVKATNDQS